MLSSCFPTLFPSLGNTRKRRQLAIPPPSFSSVSITVGQELGPLVQLGQALPRLEPAPGQAGHLCLGLSPAPTAGKCSWKCSPGRVPLSVAAVSTFYPPETPGLWCLLPFPSTLSHAPVTFCNCPARCPHGWSPLCCLSRPPSLSHLALASALGTRSQEAAPTCGFPGTGDPCSSPGPWKSQKPHGTLLGELPRKP